MRFRSRRPERPLRSDGDQRRSRILSAAKALFAARGFEGATTRQIASASRSNIAAIRYYFGDKAGLVIAVIEQTIRDVAEGGQHPTVRADLPPRQALREWVRWVLRTGRRRQRGLGAGPRVVMQSLAVRGPLARLIADRVGAPVRANIHALIDLFFPESAPAPVRERAFVLIFSLCSHFAHSGPVLENMGIAVPEDDAALDALAEDLARFIVGGLAGLHPLRPGILEQEARADA